MKHVETRILFFVSGLLISTLFHNDLHGMLQPAVPPAGQAASYWTQRALLQGGTRTAPFLRRSFSTQPQRPQHISPQRWDDVTGDVENMTKYPQAYIDAESLAENPSAEKVEEITERSNQRYKSLFKKPSSPSLFSPTRSPFLERSRPFSSSPRSAQTPTKPYQGIGYRLRQFSSSSQPLTQTSPPNSLALKSYQTAKWPTIFPSEYYEAAEKGFIDLFARLSNLPPFFMWSQADQNFIRALTYDLEHQKFSYQYFHKIPNDPHRVEFYKMLQDLKDQARLQQYTELNFLQRAAKWAYQRSHQSSEDSIKKIVKDLDILEQNLFQEIEKSLKNQNLIHAKLAQWSNEQLEAFIFDPTLLPIWQHHYSGGDFYGPISSYDSYELKYLKALYSLKLLANTIRYGGAKVIKFSVGPDGKWTGKFIFDPEEWKKNWSSSFNHTFEDEYKNTERQYEQAGNRYRGTEEQFKEEVGNRYQKRMATDYERMFETANQSEKGKEAIASFIPQFEEYKNNRALFGTLMQKFHPDTTLYTKFSTMILELRDKK
jgi:hypothetical protein